MHIRLEILIAATTILGLAPFNTGAADTNSADSVVKDAYALCDERDSVAFRKKYMASMFTWENDSMIFPEDSQYTNGMKYTVIKDPVCDNGFFGKSQPGQLVGWTLGMNMYTPSEISDPKPPEDDRPWSGWLYVGGVWQWYSTAHDGDVFFLRYSHTLELLFGGLGEYARQDNVQRAWHELRDAPEPMGWHNQKTGEYGVSASYQYRKNFRPSTNVTTVVRGGVRVGNVLVLGNVGGRLSFQIFGGHFDDLGSGMIPANLVTTWDSSIQPSVLVPLAVNSNNQVVGKKPVTLGDLRKKWADYSNLTLFVDAECRAIGYSYFLDGSKISTTPFVCDLQGGFTYKPPGWLTTFGISAIRRTSEFDDASGRAAPAKNIFQATFERSWGFVSQ